MKCLAVSHFKCHILAYKKAILGTVILCYLINYSFHSAVFMVTKELVFQHGRILLKY